MASASAAKWLARDRGAFDSQPTVREIRIVQSAATAELQDFLTEIQRIAIWQYSLTLPKC